MVLGKTDLATRFPDLAFEWSPSWNDGVSPHQVLPGSHRIVWWQCANGHIWQVQIKSRFSGCGCPACAGKIVLSGENDLASQFPQIAEQWVFSKNGTLSPQKVWRICLSGHVWKAIICSRAGTQKTAVPYLPGGSITKSKYTTTALWTPALPNSHVTPLSTHRHLLH